MSICLLPWLTLQEVSFSDDICIMLMSQNLCWNGLLILNLSWVQHLKTPENKWSQRQKLHLNTQLKHFSLTCLSSLAMSKAGDSGGEADGVEKAPVFTKFSSVSSGPGWTKVSCPCCVRDRVEPLVLVKLGRNVCPDTKRWLIKLIGSAEKNGGNWLNFLIIYACWICKCSKSN